MSGVTKARRDIYEILRGIAVSQDGLISYSELSERLKDRPDPHRGLSRLLDDLNMVCASAKLPPISALVVRKDENGQLGQPGPGFWKCPAVQPAPKSETDRLQKWLEYV